MSSMYGTGPTGGSMQGNKIPKGYQLGQIQQFTPEMMQLFQSLFGQLGEGSYLSRLASGDPELFAEMERPALQQFSGQLGNLASKFSGTGLGGRRSSGFQNTATSAASQFAQDLQSRRQGLQQQALRDLFGLSSNLLAQRPYEHFLAEKEPSFWEKIFGVGLPLAGAAVGGAFGGPWGAMAGSQVGAAAGRAFY